MNGIDLSYHNGKVDFNSVKSADIDFVIIRAGFGRSPSQKDRKFEDYYTNAKTAGLPIGAYWYSYADSVEDARTEAAACINVLSGKQFEYPIFYDLEDSSQSDFSKETITDMAIAFCETLEGANYYTGIYANTDWWINKIDQSKTNRFTRWLADYRANPNTTIPRDILQYTSSGSVSGINGRVDLNTGYKDFPAIIIPLGKNGFSGNNPPQESDTTYKYQPGDYIVSVSKLNVRTGPGVNYSIKPISNLSLSAQAQGGYVNGVIFTAKRVVNNPGESWAQTPSGWVCIQNQNGIYAYPLSETPNYSAGDYIVVADRLNVRTGPGINYSIKPISDLSLSAQAQGGYVNGVIFTAKRVINNPGESWASTPSGWVCIKNQNGVYARKV